MKLDFSSEIILENDKVLLRPMSIGDFELFLPFSKDEPELWIHSLISASGKDNLRNYMEHALRGRVDLNSYPFVVIDKESNQVAGTTRFYDYQEGNNTVQVGFTWYGKSFQGTGLNKSCKYLLLEFAFDLLNLDRVEFRADANNERSIAAMKSIGCTVEGILRSNCVSPSGRRNSIVLSILKSEWDSTIKASLKEKLQSATRSI